VTTPTSLLRLSGATVAYVVYGFAMFAALPGMKSEFMKYTNVYRSHDEHDESHALRHGLDLDRSIRASSPFSTRRIYHGGRWHASALVYRRTHLAFLVCTFVIQNYVNLNIGLHSRSTRASPTSSSG